MSPGMEARSGQNYYNKMALQVTFLASAAFIMDPLCIFVITTQDFFSVLLIFYSCMNYFLLRLFTFFMLLYESIFHAYHKLFF